MSGIVAGIYISSSRMTPMRSVEQARAIPGLGLEGDRYSVGSGTFSDPFPNPDSEVTLIEKENIEAFNREYHAMVEPVDSRRNIVTMGIRLNDLVGREFSIGLVRFVGHGLCEPCQHLATIAGRSVLPGLVGRGGLRAQVLTDGIVRTGDVVSVIAQDQQGASASD